ncbi:primosomal replication protein PriB/PriC domain protein, partial [Enterobacter hormaechei]|nr:primosomal replication protein PriB/PriC domain protein [Enterobacter hormaechei]
SVRIGERQVSFADLTEIRAEISRLQRLVAREQEAAKPNRLSGFAQADFGGEW